MIKALLTDIEGTITRISFVKDVLFPYAAQQLPAFVRGHTEQPEVAEQISAVKAEINEPNADIDTVISTLLTWIEEDKKITPLKQLQGLIWQTGYENGDFTGHLYPDAYQFLQQQIGNLILNEEEIDIANFLVGSIDESGYLRRSNEELIDDLAFTQNLMI